MRRKEINLAAAPGQEEEQEESQTIIQLDFGFLLFDSTLVWLHKV